MTKYEVIIYWSKGDEAFIAEVPELPGCAADGTTRQAALKNVDVVIKQWIEEQDNHALRYSSSRLGPVAFGVPMLCDYRVKDAVNPDPFGSQFLHQ